MVRCRLVSLSARFALLTQCACPLSSCASLSIAGLIFRQRRLILCVGIALIGVLAPSAQRILSQRVGEELQIFGEAAAMPDSDLEWEGLQTSDGGAQQLVLKQVAASWPSLYRHLAEGWEYRAPTLDFSLWPSGAVLLAVMLFIDASLLSVPALLRYCRCHHASSFKAKRARDGEEIDSCAGSIFTCGGPAVRALLLLLAAALLAGVGATVLTFQADERWAILFLGCHYPVALNATLAVGLFVHAPDLP